MKEYKYQRFVFKEIQNIETSLKVLDGYNKTRFSRRKTKDEKTLIESAQFAHCNDMIYFVTVLESEIPFAHIEINMAFFRVHFLDELRRNYMSYEFTGQSDVISWQKEIPKDKLFLSSVDRWEFNGNTDKILKTCSYIFRTNGEFIIIDRDHVRNEQVDSHAKDKIDISANWEKYPEFGDYEKLIEIERGIKLHA